MKIDIKIARDNYGSKFFVKSERNDRFIAKIKSLDWATSHRIWNGEAWVVDLTAKEELKKVIAEFDPETAKRIDFLVLEEQRKQKPEDLKYKQILDLKYNYNSANPSEFAVRSRYNEKIIEICHRYKGRFDKNTKIWYISIDFAVNFSDDMVKMFDETVKINEEIMSAIKEYLDSIVISIEITNRAVCDLTFMQKGDRFKLWAWVRKKFGFKHPNEQTIRNHSKKDLSTWDGLIVPFRFVKNSYIFDPAFCSKLAKKIRKMGYAVKIIDNRRYLPLSSQTNFNLQLYPCQNNAVDLLTDKINKQGFAMYQLPTGVGKTEIALAVIHKLKAKTVILVNRKDLLNQWKDRIQKRLGVTAGTVGMGIFDPKDITVATVQSLWSYLKEQNDSALFDADEDFLKYDLGIDSKEGNGEIEEDDAPISPDFFKMFSLVILDECHLGATRTYLKVLREFESKYFLSQSATTFRYDRMHPLLYGIFGKPYFKMTTEKAIELGLIVSPEIQIVKGIEIEDEEEDRERNYRRNLSKLIHSEERNQIIADVVREAPKPCLVLTNQITHQNEIMKAFRSNGIDAVGLNGNDKMDIRHRSLAELGRGEIDVIVATTIFDEGVDAPAVNSLVLAFPMRSDVKTIQKIGRALRKFKDKEKAIIYDFNDEDYYFSSQLEDRIKVYEKQKWTVISHESGEEY